MSRKDKGCCAFEADLPALMETRKPKALVAAPWEYRGNQVRK
jgi:hypothetical protein